MPITVYDKARWHLEGDFPKRLAAKQAFVHIGLYLGWLVQRDLIADEFRDDFEPELEQFHARKLTGPELLRKADGVLASDMLNRTGSAFTRAYYGRYLQDYDDVLGGDLPTLYHVKDTWANFDRLSARLDRRFRTWSSRRAASRK